MTDSVSASAVYVPSLPSSNVPVPFFHDCADPTSVHVDLHPLGIAVRWSDLRAVDVEILHLDGPVQEATWIDLSQWRCPDLVIPGLRAADLRPWMFSGLVAEDALRPSHRTLFDLDLVRPVDRSRPLADDLDVRCVGRRVLAAPTRTL